MCDLLSLPNIGSSSLADTPEAFHEIFFMIGVNRLIGDAYPSKVIEEEQRKNQETDALSNRDSVQTKTDPGPVLGGSFISRIQILRLQLSYLEPSIRFDLSKLQRNARNHRIVPR